VVKGTNSSGIAIQGGGLPSESVYYVDLAVDVAETNDYAGQLAVANPPGIATNILNLPVVTMNAAAVATNFVLNRVVVATNAPMLTFTWIEAQVGSSNSWGGVASNFGFRMAGYTNHSLVERATTNIVQAMVVVTNDSGSTGTTLHVISVQAVSSNVLRTPAVATNFVNAGYTILESVANGLAHSNGVISMANSGPNTDGSQFFITAADVPGWDGGYSVFGHVVSGRTVVAAIAAVPVQGAGSRPVEDVHLHAVAIRREGTAAESFDIHGQNVPAPENGRMRAVASGANINLELELGQDTQTLFRESVSLDSWETTYDFGYYAGATMVITNPVPLSTLGDTYFFHVSRIRYPIPRTAPASIRGRTFTFYWDVAPPLIYQVTFNNNFLLPGEAWITDGTNAPVARQVFSGDGWSRSIYSSRLYFMDGSGTFGREYHYSLGFNPGQTTNRFTGNMVDVGSGIQYSISGVFTME
jgi:cyclophilin family peptidyl-prolyl cis-trans isomerase